MNADKFTSNLKHHINNTLEHIINDFQRVRKHDLFVNFIVWDPIKQINFEALMCLAIVYDKIEILKLWNEFEFLQYQFIDVANNFAPRIYNHGIPSRKSNLYKTNGMVNLCKYNHSKNLNILNDFRVQNTNYVNQDIRKQPRSSDIKSKIRSETRLVSNIKSKIRSETRLVSNIKSKIRSETRLVSVSNMKKSCMGIKSGSLRYCSNLSLSDLLFLIVKYNRINILEWFFSYEKQSPKQNQSVLFGSTGSTTGFSRKRFIYFLPWMMNIAVSYNNIEVLQWGTTIMSRSILLDHIIYPVLPDSFTLHWALKKGFVDIINWGSKQPLYITPKMRTRGFHIEDTNTQKLYSVDVSTMNKAASYGHINILEWGIHQTPCIYPNEYGLNCAASKGYLNVLIWADKFYFDCVNKKLPFLKSNVISGTSWIIPNTNSYRFSQQNTGTLEEFRLSLLPTQFGLNKAYKGGYNDVIVWGKQKNIIPSNIYILNTILKSIFSF